MHDSRFGGLVLSLDFCRIPAARSFAGFSSMPVDGIFFFESGLVDEVRGATSTANGLRAISDMVIG